MLTDKTIAIIGLGYVGLPLAVAFGKVIQVIGYDIDDRRVQEISEGLDKTLECTFEDISSAKHLTVTSNLEDLKLANIYIVTVPTPVDDAKHPNFEPLRKASEAVASILAVGDIVVYESTVFPGATEEICVPILEAASGLKFNRDFFCGYSPERINPGDKEHRLSNIKKVTSGSTIETAIEIDELYAKIISAGTHMASSIKVAEASKVIENTQRDLNIALMNELSLIFNLLKIDTNEVLEAAGTKWNFLPFKPGLVGGHCIGVDPYYLTFKAQQVGYNPEVILAGRRINDRMARHVATDVIKLMLKKELDMKNSKILVLGFTFKEDCPDFRNTKVADLVTSLKEFNMHVDVFDPHIDAIEVKNEFGLDCLEKDPPPSSYDVVILAVPHKYFLKNDAYDVISLGKSSAIIYDLKGQLPRGLAHGGL